MAAAAAAIDFRAAGWSAFSVHLAWNAEKGKKKARFPPDGWATKDERFTDPSGPAIWPYIWPRSGPSGA